MYGSCESAEVWFNRLRECAPSFAVTPMIRDVEYIPRAMPLIQAAVESVSRAVLVDCASASVVEYIKWGPKMIPLVRCGRRDKYICVTPWSMQGRTIWINRSPFWLLWQQYAEFTTAGAIVEGLIHDRDVFKILTERHMYYRKPGDAVSCPPDCGEIERTDAVVRSLRQFWDCYSVQKVANNV